ncbi:MAG TPA: hypothetical protein VNT01_16365 [Symbiobacteriaceae bacterium]|nr:hypothetical protein [Symbiobacteriaceae bacterium]
MRRNPRHFAALAATVLTIGSLLALSIFLRTYLREPVPRPEAHQPAFGSGPDLDGDGRTDLIAVAASGVTVTAATGGKLLDYAGPVLSGYQVSRLGGEYPVLFVRLAEAQYVGFAFDPGKGIMQMVTWPGGQLHGFGELTAGGELRRSVVGGATLRQQVVHLSLDKLRLEESGSRYEPLASPLPTPAEALTAAVEAAVLGLESELSVHFPDRAVARAFYDRWHGKLPAGGAVRVAQADDVNAGAMHGHRVPVTVWVSGKEAVAGLQGEAEFVSGPGGVQILRIELDALPLKVGSWAEAARLAGAGAGAKPVAAPFYGLFRFEGWTVDARTGKVERD